MSKKTSTAARIFSASAASWARIGVTVLTQIAFVPLYLSHWDPSTFGAWLVLQALWSAINLIDLGHADYVGFECLRVKEADADVIGRIISSAFLTAMAIAVVSFLTIFFLATPSRISSWIGFQGTIPESWRIVLVTQAVIWLFVGNQAGIVVRWLTPFGYFPKFAWWNAAFSLFTALVPAIAVVYGANLLEAGLAMCGAILMYYVLFLFFFARVIRRENLSLKRPDIRLAFRNLKRSLWLTARYGTDMLRQQGVRIFLLPLVGPSQTAAFSTIRTGANFALQGLNTATGPVMPELMRFLRDREQQKMESALAVVWLVVVALLCPAMILFQFLAPLFFDAWTHGKIAFDALLFAMLSVGVLVFALAQPANAVLQGNNIVKAAFFTSMVCGVFVFVALQYFVPRFGIVAAGASLVFAESISLILCVGFASTLLRQLGLQWPWRAFVSVFFAVMLTSVVLILMAKATLLTSAIYLVVGFLGQIIVGLVYWKLLPIIARDKVYKLVIKLRRTISFRKAVL